MAVDEVETVSKSESKSPYQLDLTQTTKACKALLRNIADEKSQKDAKTSKPNLLAAPSDASPQDADAEHDDVPVWLILSTKQHIVDQKRLKPGKISIPHPIHTSPASTICLITADPQRTYKDVISSPDFPAALRSRITRVVGLSKLKTKYKAFEARRKLVAEHDIFLADDRVIVYLPHFLGKIFYKSGNKRPVPVSIAGPPKRDDQGKRLKRLRGPGVKRQAEETDSTTAPSPDALAKELYRALDSAMVHLAPGTSTAVKVARATFTAEMCAANVKAVVDGLTEKFVTKGWRNVRAIHVKGPESVAFPIWLADQLWVEDDDVLEKKKTFGKKAKLQQAADRPLIQAADLPLIQAAESVQTSERNDEGARKRKAENVGKPETGTKHAEKKRKAELDEKLAAETIKRKKMLKSQKAGVLAAAQ